MKHCARLRREGNLSPDRLSSEPCGNGVSRNDPRQPDRLNVGPGCLGILGIHPGEDVNAKGFRDAKTGFQIGVPPNRIDILQ